MKRIVSIIAIVISILLLTVAFCGCDSESESNKQSSVALVIGAHKFNPKFTVSPQLRETINNAARSFGELSVTVSSGTPETVASYNLDVARKDVGDAKLHQIAQANTEVIVKEISNICARNSEVDTLSAIIQAANNLKETKSPIKTLIIYDSGLSTSGHLTFNNPCLILNDAKSLTKKLKKEHAIPDLRGMDVTWFGIGQVRGEQKRLDSENQYRLKSIYRAILNEGKPKSLTFVDAELTSEYNDSGFPNVSICSLFDNGIDIDETMPEESNESKEIDIKLSDEKLKFKPDTAEFANESSASDTLDLIAEKINKSSKNIYVIGSTATYGPHESTMVLSNKRAYKVKNELKKRGVNVKITALGIGDTKCNTLRVEDTDSKGNLIEKRAKLNRATFIISENSPTIKQLQKEGVI